VEARTFAAVLGSVSDVVVPTDQEISGYYQRIKASAAVYRALATETMASAAADRNKRLNSRGNVTEYKVGDQVAIYFPTRGVDSSWKQKHMLQWRGPLVITGRQSATTYSMRDPRSPKSVKDYTRAVVNINPYRAEGVHSAGDDVVHPFGLEVGMMVAAVDQSGSDVVSVGKVEHLDADEVVLHYWVTRGSNPATAVFKPAHIGIETGKTILVSEFPRFN
jgi:hypothetical protein